LAYHALRGEVWDKALAYCRQAGEKALARSAHHEARGYFEQALSALPHLPETRDLREQAVDLRFALCSALRPLGEYERMSGYLQEAESLAIILDDPRRLGWVSLLQTREFYLMATYSHAIATAQRVLALATSYEDDALQARANQYLGLACLNQGDYRRAIACLRQTATSRDGTRRYELLGDAFVPAVFSRAILAWCHAELGMFAEGAILGAEGLQMAETLAHRVSFIWPYYGLGMVSLCQGDLRQAIPQLERAVSISHERDLRAYYPRMAAALGAAYTLDRRLTEAVPLLTQTLEQCRAQGRAYLETLCSLPLGEAQMLAGHLEEAYNFAERALVLTREYQGRSNQAYALRLMGEIAMQRKPPDVDQAEAHYRQALTLADELGMRPLQAHCHRSLGTLYAATGQREQARTALSTAIALYRAMEMTFWLPQTEATLAQVEGR
jgi:tetratricopeptide (TPR) repeat protein